MHAVCEYGMFEELRSSNPCSGWRLKGVKYACKAIIATPQQTFMILRSLTYPLHSRWCSPRWSDILWKENLIRVNERWWKGRDGKPFKRMAGTTRLELATSAVTESLAGVTYWNLTVLTARS